MRAKRFFTSPIAMIPLVVLAASAPARAATFALTPADFAGAALIDFGPTQTLAPIHGQVINGVTFGFTLNNVASNAAIIDGGPGNTNNITIANVTNINGTNNGAVLSMLFPTLQTRMGYGFAVLSVGTVPNATTVSLFDATNTLVGTLSANGSPDPFFTGGFLGVGSTIPFLRAEVTFASSLPAFAFDNLRFDSDGQTVIPEPATVTLVALGLLAIARKRLA